MSRKNLKRKLDLTYETNETNTEKKIAYDFIIDYPINYGGFYLHKNILRHSRILRTIYTKTQKYIFHTHFIKNTLRIDGRSIAIINSLMIANYAISDTNLHKYISIQYPSFLQDILLFIDKYNIVIPVTIITNILNRSLALNIPVILDKISPSINYYTDVIQIINLHISTTKNAYICKNMNMHVLLSLLQYSLSK